MKLSNHNKIIAQVANAVFMPKGFFRKGKSRTWLYDCGYCIVQVEFQPSAYSKGTFCNVGISFLFEYYGQLNECLAFHYGWKRISSGKSEFIEYTGDDEQFEAQMHQLTNNALKYAEQLMKFKSLKYADRKMSNMMLRKAIKELFRKWNGSIDDYYNAAMIKFLRKNLNCGKRLMRKLNSIKSDGDWKPWAGEAYSKFFRDDITAEEARNIVHEMIKVRRDFFKQKPSFKGLPSIEEFSNI